MEKAFRDEFFLAGIKLAELASDITRDYFRKPLNIESKTYDHSPVSIADKKIEESLRAWIKNNYPSHGIIGEEYLCQNKTEKYTWVIDPIDGTVAFLCGKPTFTTLIALLENDTAQIGLIDQPILEDRFIGVTGCGAWLNGKKLVTSDISLLADARLNATTPYMFKAEIEQQKFSLLKGQVKLTGFGGDAYSYGLLANGHIDLIMEADLHFYDVAALIPVIEESGGVITDWSGNKITPKSFCGQCLAASNQRLHEAALRIIA